MHAGDSRPTTIRAAYSMWPHYDRAIRDAVAGLSDEQLATSPANGHWPLWAIAGHLACQRVFWLCDFAGVARDADTPFPDAPFNCPGDDDLEHVLSGPALADALERTFVIVERALDTWTTDMLDDELRRPEWGDDWVHTRAAVVQRVLAHDVYHAAEASTVLVALGLPAIDLWP